MLRLVLPQGQSALHWAAESGSSAAAQLLLQTGIDPRPRDEEGQTAADLAASRGFEECASLIRAYPFDPAAIAGGGAGVGGAAHMRPAVTDELPPLKRGAPNTQPKFGGGEQAATSLGLVASINSGDASAAISDLAAIEAMKQQMGR